MPELFLLAFPGNLLNDEVSTMVSKRMMREKHVERIMDKLMGRFVEELVYLFCITACLNEFI